MKDLVITAVTNYSFRQIAPWVNSLERSGFQGLKAVVAYNLNGEAVKELSRRGFLIFGESQDPTTQTITYHKQKFSVVVDRFLHYYHFINVLREQFDIRYVIATDARDVIFQKNPSDYISSIEDPIHRLLLSSEGIAYKDEPWGRNNLIESYGPMFYEQHCNYGIINCGVLAGDLPSFLALSKIVFLISSATKQDVPGGGGPDQAALNLFLANPMLSSKKEITTHRGTWAAQLGTMMDPNKINSYRPYLTDPEPKLVGDYVVNSSGEPFTIVHQWDRVPEVRVMVERRYS